MFKKVITFIVISLLVSSTLYAVSTDTCNDTDTKLMLHMNGTDGSTTFTDSSAVGRSMTANGNVQIDTAQSKFGGASALFDGSGDYITTASSSDWDFGTGDFTIDMWVRLNDTSGEKSFFAKAHDTGTGFQFQLNSPDLQFSFSDGTNNINLQASWSPSTATWYHITLTRSGTTFRLFSNGTQIGTTTDSDSITITSQDVSIGSKDGGKFMDGWIDELRVVKGTAVWTSNFTSPTAEYSNTCVTRRRMIPTAVVS